MKAVDDYIRHADECERLAQRAITAKEREILRQMAAAWRLLAGTRKKALAVKQKVQISN